MKNIIHKSAIIDEGAIIGSGTVIWHWTHVSKKAIIGNHCKLGQNVYVANNVRIGNNCKIQNNVSIYEGVEIGNDVFCGPSMVFTNVLNPRSHISRNKDFKKTVISDGVTLGANCTIVCGTKIGKYAFIGAGAVVVNDLKPYVLAVGSPAKQIGWMSKDGYKLDLPLHGNGKTTCKSSGMVYKLVNGNCEMIGS